jgi:hypothetical protein
MAIVLSERAKQAAREANKEPQLLVRIDGIDTLFTSGLVGKYWKIGDPEVIPPLGSIGMAGLTVGGIVPIAGQETLISFDQGTTTVIQQQLEADDGTASVSSMQLGFIDTNGVMTELISPSLVVDDMLGRSVEVFFGFSNVGFPDDFFRLHLGIVDEIMAGQGMIQLNVAHPEQLKRQQIFIKAESKLSGAMDASQTTVPLVDASGFLERVTGPNGGYDSGFESYVKIGDELIKYVGISGDTLTGCTRGQFGTIAEAHDADEGAESFYRIKGTLNECAMKLYHSYRGGFFEQLAVENFVQLSPTEQVQDAIFFKDINLDDYGIFPGQYVTVSGSSAGNNGTWLVESVNKSDLGSYLTVISHNFNLEIGSPAQCSFRSQWDVWPSGLGIHPKFVDLERHDFISRTFLSSFEYDFYLKDTVEGKDFIDKEIYMPASAYSLPRGGRISLGYHVPPIPSVELARIDKSVIINPEDFTLARTISKNFYNAIVYKFDEDAIEDNFFGGAITVSATSQLRIPIGNRVQTIESLGLKSTSQGVAQALSSGSRRIKRYEFGAEFIDNIKLFFEFLTIEAGDIILMNFEDLNIVNTREGNRTKEPALMEVSNRTIDIANGEVSIDIVDTNFETASRYALFSPSSFILHAASQKQFTITSSFASRFGDNEFRKWEKWIGAAILVRSPDSTTRYAWSYLVSVAGNNITLQNNLGFTPQNGDIMELYKYVEQTDDVKLVWGFMADDPPGFADGKTQYQML